MEYGAPSAVRIDSNRDEDLVIVVEVLNDILTSERRLVVRITPSIPHEIAPLLIRQMIHSWGRFVACISI